MNDILFVDDEPRLLDGLKRLLHPKRKAWNLHFATDGAAALSLLAEFPISVLVSDMRMAPMDGPDLLAAAQARHPHVVRVVLSGHTEVAALVKIAPLAHQFLSKPCDAAHLVETLERLLEPVAPGEEAFVAALRSVRCLPSPARVHAELAELLDCRRPSLAAIGRLAERDVALAARLYHLVSSDFFGRLQRFPSVSEAVVFLGAGVLRQLFDTDALCAPVEGYQAAWLERCNRHAQRVSWMAAQLKHGPDCELAAAALLHDVGLWLGEALCPGRGFDCDVGPLERHIGGYSHALAGRTLLSQWGLPAQLVAAVGQHEARSPQGMGAVVALADVLINAYERGEAAPAWATTAALHADGWRDRLERWDDQAEAHR